jgi:Fe-S-cluster containining protein
MPTSSSTTPWYVAGLAFECTQCGGCCAGPAEGYVWVTSEEIARISAFLKMTEVEFHRKYLKRVSGRYTIIEDRSTRDCMFLRPDGHGGRTCGIYSVRPMQCRTWPFWTINISTPDDWLLAGDRCPGINRGRLHSREEIEERSHAT